MAQFERERAELARLIGEARRGGGPMRADPPGDDELRQLKQKG